MKRHWGNWQSRLAWPDSSPNPTRFAPSSRRNIPGAPSTGMVTFRAAENAFNSKKLAEAAQRYGVVVDKYPEFGQVNAARKGMGTSLYELGKFEEAAAALQQVPPNERVGEMAGVSYLLAECLIKTMPADADDALATARLVDQIEQASSAAECICGGSGESSRGARSAAEDRSDESSGPPACWLTPMRKRKT